MKYPIQLTEGNFSSIICAMLKEAGAPDFTLSKDTYDKLDLGNTGLMCFGEFEREPVYGDFPTSITVCVASLEDLADFFTEHESQ